MSTVPDDLRGHAVTASVVIPVDGPPLPGGVVEIGPSGKIVSVRNRAIGPTVDLGDVAILPGLVNAHTHLEFSTLDEPLEAGPVFTEWVRRLVGWRRNQGDRETALRAGMAELRRFGTAAVGEIVTAPATPADHARLVGVDGYDAEAVLFQEIIASRPEHQNVALATAAAHLAASTSLGLRAGISPHAPYSVTPMIFWKLAALAADHRVPLATHLAETHAERRFLETGEGPFAEMLTDFGAGTRETFPRGVTFADYLKPLRDVPRVALVHGNVLDGGEIAAVAAMPNVTVVYCPRTHAHFGHGRHPWREILAAGGKVAFGTDGRGSNPDLSVWREVLHVAAAEADDDRAGLAETLLRCVTTAAAEPLGLRDVAGAIRPGVEADLTLLDLDGVPSSEDPLAGAIDREREPVAAYRAGRLASPAPEATISG